MEDSCLFLDWSIGSPPEEEGGVGGLFLQGDSRFGYPPGEEGGVGGLFQEDSTYCNPPGEEGGVGGKLLSCCPT